MIGKQNKQRDAHAPHGGGYAVIGQMAEEWDVSLRILDQTLHFSGRVALWPVSLRYHFSDVLSKDRDDASGILKPGALKRIVCCYFQHHQL